MKGWLQVVREAAINWNKDNVLRLGAAVSYYTVFSLGPLFIISIGIASVFFGEQAARGELSSQLEHLVGKGGGDAIEEILASSGKHSAGIVASLIGIAILLFGATSVFTELKADLNLIWKCEAKRVLGIRGFFKDRLLSFAMVLSIGFLLLVSLILSAVIAAAGEKLSRLFHVSISWLHLVSDGASFVLITILFALIFKVLPDTEVEWKDVWVGGAITSFLFVIGKFLIGLYLGQSAVASAYGASGSLVVILIWTYYSSLILFFGAELTRSYSYHFGSKKIMGHFDF